VRSFPRRFLPALLLPLLLLLPPFPLVGGGSAPPELRILLDSAPDKSLLGADSPWQVNFPQSGAQVSFSGGESLAVWPLTDPWWVILRAGTVPALEQAVATSPDLWQEVGKPLLAELKGVFGLALGPYKSQAAAQSDLDRASSAFPQGFTTSGRYSFFLETDRAYDFGWASDNGGVAFRFTSQAPLDYAGRHYRGALEVFVRSGDSPALRVVNDLDLESYLYGVVPAEISPSWATEAVKAQAVAARSYALRKLQGGTPVETEGYDLTASVSDQVYKGYNVEAEAGNLAVDSTRGQVLTYAGEVISALFHDCSGGITENNENVFSGPPLPYLRSVASPGEEACKYFSWTATISTADFIMAAEKKKGVTLGDLVSLNVVEKGVSGRIRNLQVIGTAGTCTLTGEQLRQVAGLRSSLTSWTGEEPGPVEPAGLPLLSVAGPSTIAPANAVLLSALGTANLPDLAVLLGANGPAPLVPSVTPPTPSPPAPLGGLLVFTGHGDGHGLGMPQWGAKARGEEGKDYRAILTYYYTGVQLETRY
jgi:stage II sporulation protein D